MIDLKSAETVQIVVYLVVPGLIVLFVRSRFLTGRMQKPSDAVLPYFVVSLIYWTCLSTLGISPASLAASPGWSSVAVLVAPTILGFLLGLNARFDLVRRLLRKVRINPAHATATAWDWKMSRATECFVIVTLSKGERIAGFFGANSFASSDPAERDLFLEKIYEIPEEGPWREIPEKGLLLRPGEIRYIEFIEPQ